MRESDKVRVIHGRPHERGESCSANAARPPLPLRVVSPLPTPPRVTGGSMSFDMARAAAKAYESDVAHLVNSWHEQNTKGTSDMQGK